MPTTQQFKLSITQIPNNKIERSYMDRITYASIVGSLMYGMVYTKPYITYSVSLVSRYMESLRKAHWKALKWILRYIK